MPTAYTPGKYPEVPKTMIATIAKVDQALAPSLSVPSEVRGFIYDKTIAAKVLSWDNFTYGTEAAYQPEDVEAVCIQEDIVWYRVGANQAVPIAVEQFIYFHQQIMESESEVIDTPVSQEEVVALAKEIGSQIWEHGCKLGYVVQYGSWFYAVTEYLTRTGFQYAYSRHGSFYLAHSELVERSWEVEDVGEAA